MRSEVAIQMTVNPRLDPTNGYCEPGDGEYEDVDKYGLRAERQDC